MMRPPPRSPLFPYTTLFRSGGAGVRDEPLMQQDEVTVDREELLVVGPCLLLEATMGMHERDRKSTRLNSSHANISYAVSCLKKKNMLPILCQTVLHALVSST